PRNPPKLSTAYETVPLVFSIITRSIEPILLSSAPYTAVPSTLSLPIRLPVSRSSTVIGQLLPGEVLQPPREPIVPLAPCRPHQVNKGTANKPDLCGA